MSTVCRNFARSSSRGYFSVSVNSCSRWRTYPVPAMMRTDVMVQVTGQMEDQVADAVTEWERLGPQPVFRDGHGGASRRASQVPEVSGELVGRNPGQVCRIHLRAMAVSSSYERAQAHAGRAIRPLFRPFGADRRRFGVGPSRACIRMRRPAPASLLR